ncbi:MAG TPA: malto-oligosyltrehalose synthase [Blastocatellia bacterium]|nr:malto-oligosyltrehalose synthase [Blastocatellia bacterium]
MIETDKVMRTEARIPSATYRLQFNRQFTFKDALRLVDYLAELGISDIYASPLFVAQPGSPHGYDIIDHSRFNPDLGTEEDFIALARSLKERGLGIIMDAVPNHMSIGGGANPWWNDVLENGPSSPYARYFDIDWHPPKADLADKVLLPMLGEQYGRVLENHELTLKYEQGSFFIDYYETRLPIATGSYAHILSRMIELLQVRFGESHPDLPDLMELESITTAIGYLPPRTETDEERLRERYREQEVIKRRIDNLIEESEAVSLALQTTLEEFNGTRGKPSSFDRLERLLDDQAYRLSFWRVAADEINYRRFFDINELAAIRVEELEVFVAIHELILRLMRQGWVTGLRIDHVDGLFDPAQYLRDLQIECLNASWQSLGAGAAAGGVSSPSTQLRGDPARPNYIVVEKILGPDELLPADWAIYGTTGYGFLNLLNGIFIETRSRRAFERLYQAFIGEVIDFSDLVYQCKKLILRVAMSSELHVLARRLDRVSEQHRYTRDFTLNSLQYALSEVIACFPIYRTYTQIDQPEVNEEDQRHIRRAIQDAKRRNPAHAPSLFDFIGSLLLLDEPEGLTDEHRAERRNFVLRFQQLTSPVMAKGLEDTAFYRYFPLASLNEVGGEPSRFGVPIAAFHEQNQRRRQERPHGFSATSTHDTKRSEDVRVRINVLSEMPERWAQAIQQWRVLNQGKKIPLWSGEAPDGNDEYLIYQTLVGAWPIERLSPEALAEFTTRMEDYAIKAVLEAKVHSSWISPEEEYERGIRQFIRSILTPTPDNQFMIEMIEFCRPIARAGMFNSLSQLLLKITSPGAPDFYQGMELWNQSLVDPDNRRPVDFELRLALLNQIREAEQGDLRALLDHMMQHPEDGRIKMFLTRRALQFRRAHHDLFMNGEYQPLSVTGRLKNHVLAFARITPTDSVIIAAARFFTSLGVPERLPIGQEVWEEAAITLDKRLIRGSYRNVLTGEVLTLDPKTTRGRLALAEVFARLPVAMLERL